MQPHPRPTWTRTWLPGSSESARPAAVRPATDDRPFPFVLSLAQVLHPRRHLARRAVRHRGLGGPQVRRLGRPDAASRAGYGEPQGRRHERRTPSDQADHRHRRAREGRSLVLPRGSFGWVVRSGVADIWLLDCQDATVRIWVDTTQEPLVPLPAPSPAPEATPGPEPVAETLPPV